MFCRDLAFDKLWRLLSIEDNTLSCDISYLCRAATSRCDVYKNQVNLALFTTSYLQVEKLAKNNVDEIFVMYRVSDYDSSHHFKYIACLENYVCIVDQYLEKTCIAYQT